MNFYLTASEADKTSVPPTGSPGCVVFYKLEPSLFVNSAVYFLNEVASLECNIFYIQLAYIHFVYFYGGFLCRAVQGNSHENNEMTIGSASAFLWIQC